jgi:GT2 family glycosyltransferase
MNICVVLVTFNRKNDLEKTLSVYEKQTVPPKAVIVVDNHSTDGTAELLAEWEKKQDRMEHILISMPENVGGSGGFYAGMKAALDYDCDWIFVSDDDALPQEATLENIVNFADKNPDVVSECAAICTSVIDNDGHYAVCHRSNFNSTIGAPEPAVSESEYKKEYFELQLFSYVGSCIRKEALVKAGLPRKEFFIYFDDHEHAIRVGKEGKIICVPAAVLYHQGNSPSYRAASWRDYYETRNILIMYLEHFGRSAFKRRALMRRLTGLRSLNPTKMKVISAGIKDAKRGVTGLHSVYRPGWNPKKKG